jgi:hypothetical protein
MHVRLASDTMPFRKSTLWMEYELVPVDLGFVVEYDSQSVNLLFE